MTELSDLVGERVLQIAPFNLRHPVPGSDANGVIFTLDSTTYLVFEDESDGYRSRLGVILSFEGDAYQLGGGSFYPEYICEPVLCSHSICGEYGVENDILEIRSKATGVLLFRVGTTNVDDYYPSFVSEWNPAGLSANQPEPHP